MSDERKHGDRRDKYSLTSYQEHVLIEARAKLILLIGEDPDSLGKGTMPFGWVTDMIEDIEHLLGY